MTYTREQLKTAFEQVEDKKHWKNPINRRLPVDGLDFDLITEAVIHFTGSIPQFLLSEDKKDVTVLADGYYNTIGS